jgi:hypothetical protein
MFASLNAALVVGSASSGSGFSIDPTVLYVALWIGGAGGIGALIGSGRGRGGLGFVLGVLLGLIGWIIVAVVSRTPEKEAEYQHKVSVASQQLSAGPSNGTQTGTSSGQWAPDPFGRFRHRWFNGQQWTDKVSDGGQQIVDLPEFPLPEGSAGSEGWAPDPYGRFAQRFHTPSGWSAHVARDGHTFTDPPGFPAPSA